MLDNGAFEETAARVQTSLDLTSGPVFRAVLFEHPEAQARLLLCAHHLAVDGVSWRILLEDLATAYQNQSSGKSTALPPKTTSFKCWAERLFEYAQSKQLHAEAERWLDAASWQLPMRPLIRGLKARRNRWLRACLQRRRKHSCKRSPPRMARD